MESKTKEHLEHWAGEYVLGTLNGGNLQTFRRALVNNSVLQALVYEWQERLQPMTRSDTSHVPGKQVWVGICEKLNIDTLCAEDDCKKDKAG